jgi:hypothetical protein
MTQALYAHMNNKRKKNSSKDPILKKKKKNHKKHGWWDGCRCRPLVQAPVPKTNKQKTEASKLSRKDLFNNSFAHSHFGVYSLPASMLYLECLPW